MTEHTPDEEAQIEAEFDEALEGSSLRSPAAQFISDLGQEGVAAWAERQAARVDDLDCNCTGFAHPMGLPGECLYGGPQR